MKLRFMLLVGMLLIGVVILVSVEESALELRDFIVCVCGTGCEADSRRFDMNQTSRAKIVSDWQADESVAADRESEKLDDPSYGVARRFTPLGTASFLFVHFSSYRTGQNKWAVIGLGAKSLFLYSNPEFFCSWYPHEGAPSATAHCNATFVQPSSNHVSFGKEYVGTVVHCEFDEAVGIDGAGGHLVVLVTHGTDHNSGLQDVSLTAKVEEPGEYNASLFRAPYRYRHVYCGAAVWGSYVNPQRVREWMAYHVRFFGDGAHFVLYDGGAMDEDVRRVLRPWVNLGFVTIMNARQENRYSTHIHNQFVILNDCMFRARTLAPWTWFFDMDEFIHMAPGSRNLDDLLADIEKDFAGPRLQRIAMLQMPMDLKHCVRDETRPSDWGMEKTVFRRSQVIEPGGWMDAKNLVRPDAALAVGPHEPVRMTMPEGATEAYQVTSWQSTNLHYYHYHGAIGKKEEELCQELVDPALLVNVTSIEFNNVTHVLDYSMKSLAEEVKRFESRMIGGALAWNSTKR